MSNIVRTEARIARRNAAALIGLQGATSPPHLLQMVIPQIRGIFRPVDLNGPSGVDCLLTGNAGQLRTADVNLNGWMPTDNEFIVWFRRYRVELYFVPGVFNFGATSPWDAIMLASTLALEFAPQGGKIPYYYPFSGYISQGGGHDIVPEMGGEGPPTNYARQTDPAHRWYDMRFPLAIDVAKDTARIVSPPGVVIPDGMITHLILEPAIAVGYTLLDQDPTPEVGAALSALFAEYPDAPAQALAAWNRARSGVDVMGGGQ